jgi:hypothetical protein
VTRPATRTYLACGAFIALAGGVGCGDVTSQLITGSSAGSSAGSAPGGAASGGNAMAGSGGSAPGGTGGGGATDGGATAGSGGTPECTTRDDCTDPERRLCDPVHHRCVECTDEGQCGSDEDCSPDIGECARPCTSSTECVDEDDRICDPLILFCVECVGDGDCASNHCAFWKCAN